MTITSMNGVGKSGAVHGGKQESKAGGAAFDDLFKQAQAQAQGRNKEADDEAARHAVREQGAAEPLVGLAHLWMQDIFSRTRKDGETTTELGNVKQGAAQAAPPAAG